MTWEQAFEILKPIPEPDYIGGAWNETRYNKCKAIFELAQQVRRGRIVELGAFRGLGAITLALGAPKGVKVYTVDHYKGGHDFLRYEYTPTDKTKFWENVTVAGVSDRVVLLEGDVQKVARTWNEGEIELLFWDIGGINRMDTDLKAWLPHLAKDGVIAVKDLEQGGFGRENLWKLGLVAEKQFTKGSVFTYRQAMQGDKYAVWIVDGEKYIREAMQSAESVRRQMPDVIQAIYTPEKREHENWFTESTRILLKVLEQLPEGAKVLLLDSDTYMVEPVCDLFEALGTFDMAFAHAPGRKTGTPINPVPDVFPEPQIGVIAMRNCQSVRNVWHGTYTEQKRGIETDQAALRQCLWYFGEPCFTVITPEYNCRFQFGVQVRDRVKILHGKAKDAAEYEQIAAAINAGWTEGVQVPPRIITREMLEAKQ